MSDTWLSSTLRTGRHPHLPPLLPAQLEIAELPEESPRQDPGPGAGADSLAKRDQLFQTLKKLSRPQSFPFCLFQRLCFPLCCPEFCNRLQVMQQIALTTAQFKRDTVEILPSISKGFESDAVTSLLFTTSFFFVPDSASSSQLFLRYFPPPSLSHPLASFLLL